MILGRVLPFPAQSTSAQLLASKHLPPPICCASSAKLAVDALHVAHCWGLATFIAQRASFLTKSAEASLTSEPLVGHGTVDYEEQHFQFGALYTHFLYTMQPHPPYRMLGTSAEFCIGASQDAGGLRERPVRLGLGAARRQPDRRSSSRTASTTARPSSRRCRSRGPGRCSLRCPERRTCAHSSLINMRSF